MQRHMSPNGSGTSSTAEAGIRRITAIDSITAKGSHNLNEDSMVANTDTGIFAVFDGASGLNPFTDAEGRTGAYLASNIAREVFGAGGESLLGLTATANKRIRTAMAYQKIGTSDKINRWATSVAAVRVHSDSFDWVWVSDSIILVVYDDGSYKALVDDYEHDQETLSLLRELTGKGDPDPKAGIRDITLYQRRQMNITYGFVAGEEIPPQYLHTGTESLKGVRHILLFTDGMLVPKEDPRAKDDFDAVVSEYLKGGLKGWLAYVRSLEDNDPGLKRYARFHPHDDATAVAVTFE